MKKRISVPFLAAAIVVLALLAVIVIAKSIGGIPGKAVGAPLHRGAGIHRRRGKD